MNIIMRFEFWLRCLKATDFARPFLTASSVIAVMPARMLTVPNPGARNEWPAHCDGGIHYIWPFKFGAELALVIRFGDRGPHSAQTEQSGETASLTSL